MSGVCTCRRPRPDMWLGRMRVLPVILALLGKPVRELSLEELQTIAPLTREARIDVVSQFNSGYHDGHLVTNPECALRQEKRALVKLYMKDDEAIQQRIAALQDEQDSHMLDE